MNLFEGRRPIMQMCNRCTGWLDKDQEHKVLPTGEHYHTYCWYKIEEARKEAQVEVVEQNRPA